MPRVPRSSNVVPLPQNRPSPTDLLMAASVMQEKGTLPSFDERFRGTEPEFARRLNPALQGQIEDRTKMGPEELVAAENQSRKDRLIPWPVKATEAPGKLSEDAGLKDIAASKRTAASIGVAGGSR